MFEPALGSTQLPIQLTSAALSLKVKRPWRETNHSPFNADVKNERSYIISLSAHLRSVCRDSCTYIMNDVRVCIYEYIVYCLPYGLEVRSLTVGPVDAEYARAEKYTQQGVSEIPSREIPFIESVLSRPLQAVQLLNNEKSNEDGNDSELY